jgi:methionyl-tRNA synthetase
LNAELADTLGNLAARCTAATLTRALAPLAPDDGSHAPATIALAPPSSAALRTEDKDFIAAMRAHSAEVPALYERLAVSDALRNVFDMLREANRYFSANEPWKLKAPLPSEADDAARRERLRTVLYLSVEAVRLSASLLSPVLPQTSQTLLDHVLGGGAPNAALRRVSASGESRARSIADGGEEEAGRGEEHRVEITRGEGVGHGSGGYGRAEDLAPSTCAFQADATFQLAPTKLKLFAKV